MPALLQVSEARNSTRPVVARWVRWQEGLFWSPLPFGALAAESRQPSAAPLAVPSHQGCSLRNGGRQQPSSPSGTTSRQSTRSGARQAQGEAPPHTAAACRRRSPPALLTPLRPAPSPLAEGLAAAAGPAGGAGHRPPVWHAARVCAGAAAGGHRGAGGAAAAGQCQCVHLLVPCPPRPPAPLVQGPLGPTAKNGPLLPLLLALPRPQDRRRQLLYVERQMQRRLVNEFHVGWPGLFRVARWNWVCHSRRG